MRLLPSEVVGEATTSRHAWDVLTDLVEIGDRMPGGPGEAEGADVLAEDFEASGLEAVEINEFSLPGWRRGESTLTVTEPRSRQFDAEHELVALPGTKPGDIETEVVDLGYGLPPDFEAADVEGKLVLVTASEGAPDGYHRPLHRTEKYARAVDAGAAGLLFYSGLPGCLPPTGWAVLERPDDTPGPIPAAGLSHELGQRLVRYAKSNRLEVRFQTTAENDQATSRNVEAVVGPDTDQEVLVTAHVDAHDLGEGARDNGAGCALVAETGRLLAEVADELDTRVRLVAFGAEEMGFYGAHHWVDTHDLSQVKAVLNLDGIGGSRTLQVQTHGFEGIRNGFEAVADSLDRSLRIDDGVSTFSDHWAFAQRGVPSAAIRSVKTETDRRWGLGRLWSHTHADTLDKLDPRDLRALVVPIVGGVLALADADQPVEHVSEIEIRSRIPDNSTEEMKATGRWPWD